MRLKRVRREKKLSEYALVKTSGVSREYIRRLEAGQSSRST